MNEALRYAFRLLKFRPRSEYELWQRLKRRGFSESAVGETLFFLKEKKFVDDLEFVRIWVQSRLKKPFGINRIKQELGIKGIGKDLIERVFEDFADKYSEGRVVKELACRRWERLKHIQPQKARRRLFLFLLRRGFSIDRIQEAISEIRASE